jgi:NAD/NADP transhydrogenase beta subunit
LCPQRGLALGLAEAGTGLILLARSAGQLDETRAMLLAVLLFRENAHMLFHDARDRVEGIFKAI